MDNIMESKGRIKTREILADIRAGMDESQLMEKYDLTPRDLQIVVNKLSQAGFIESLRTECPIPEDRALVPVEKKARDVPRDAYERKRLRRERKARQESEKVLKILESTFHWWLLGLGMVVFVVGIGLYLMWPYIATLWFDDLALDRVLGHRGPIIQSYELWHDISIKGGPVMALIGGLLVFAGLIKRWMNRRKMTRLLARQRQALVLEASREDKRV